MAICEDGADFGRVGKLCWLVWTNLFRLIQTMGCKFCEEYREEFFAALRRLANVWETSHSNEFEVWENEPPEALDLVERGLAMRSSNPAEACAIFEQAVRVGSVVAEHNLGWHHFAGQGVRKNLVAAKQHYEAAYRGGSQLALLDYCSVCFIIGNTKECLESLKDEIKQDFLPAHYHYACFLDKLSDESRMSAEVRHHLEISAKAEQPEAMFWLGRSMLRGSHGASKIPRGAHICWRVFKMVREERERNGG